MWNSTFKSPTKQLQRKTPMKRGNSLKTNHSAKSRYGLAQRIAESLGRAIQHARGESSLLRSEQHRKNVAALPCARCGIVGFGQCAHANATKGAGVKVCDSLTFSLCCDRPGVRGCHSLHDQGGIYTKAERARIEWEFIDATRAELIRRNQWPATVEEHYQRAIVPLARMVHPETE